MLAAPRRWYPGSVLGIKNSSPVASSLAAIGSILAVTTCCLPLGTMWLAAASAGAGAYFEPFRPYLIGFAIACIAFGFWQARRATTCSPAQRRINLALLLFSTLAVGLSLLLPAYATFGGHTPPQGQPPLTTLESLDPLRARWNAAPPQATKVLVLLSPT